MRVIDHPRDATEAWLLETVGRLAKDAGIGRPEIATYESERDLLAPYHDPGTLEAFAESYKHTELGKLDERYYDVADELYDRWKAAILKNPELFSDG